MRFGAAYYPEHLPRERWETDARMMQETGFNMVRMGEFAWTLFEPRLVDFDFAWLDEDKQQEIKPEMTTAKSSTVSQSVNVRLYSKSPLSPH